MRWPWLILLAGCYQPATFCDDDCPTGDANGQTDGSPTDGNTSDVMPIEACTAKLFAAQPTMPLLAEGASYTTDGAIAIYEDEDATVAPIRETAADVTTTGDPLKFTSTPAFTLSRPRLAANGQELFALGDSIAAESFSLVKMKRVPPDRWDPPIAVVITSPASLVDQNFVPGVASDTNPRRMVASKINGELFEGVEQSGGKWTFTALPPFPNITGVARDPFLSKDGLALLFVGASGGVVQIQRAIRTSPEGAFAPPLPLLNFSNGGGGGNERTPALSPDCEKLYWSMDATSGVFTAAD